jgi:hypothetical protein
MKTMKSVWAGIYMAVAAVGMTATSANATLMDQGQTTLDTATNLQWLDLTETTGQSFNDVFVGGFGNFIANGYRYANTTEIHTLFTNAGIVDFTGGNIANPDQYQAAKLLVGLFGITATFPRSQGMAEFDPAQIFVTAPYVQYNDDVSTGAASLILNGSTSRTNVSPYVGSWLVRTAPSSAIPEPGTLALFGLGLAGLGFIRRRKAA